MLSNSADEHQLYFKQQPHDSLETLTFGSLYFLSISHNFGGGGTFKTKIFEIWMVSILFWDSGFVKNGIDGELETRLFYIYTNILASMTYI